MEQMTIYHYCGIELDPLFQRLQELKAGEECYISNEILIRKNLKDLYEIETEDLHEPVFGHDTCYERLMKILNEIR